MAASSPEHALWRTWIRDARAASASVTDSILYFVIQVQPLSPVPVPARASRPPRLVPSWYMICPSRDLRRGGVLRYALGAEPLVLFRGRDSGIVRAIPAHCVHQGVDLSHGSVAGDCLRCPLHHWEYSDRCETVVG